MRFEPSLTVKQALELFYRENGFTPEDARKNFFRIKVGPFVTYLYNPKGRRRLIHIHDIEHVLYEIDANLAGEAEISAISLSSQGRKPIMSYMYASIGVLTGLFIANEQTIRGAMRGFGRQSLFAFLRARGLCAQDLLTMTLGELRQELGILT